MLIGQNLTEKAISRTKAHWSKSHLNEQKLIKKKWCYRQKLTGQSLIKEVVSRTKACWSKLIKKIKLKKLKGGGGIWTKDHWSKAHLKRKKKKKVTSRTKAHWSKAHLKKLYRGQKLIKNVNN